LLTDPKLKGQVEALWDKFWTGGLTNPLDAIEQFSYLLFLKRLDDGENRKQRMAGILEKADRVRRLRRAARELSDGYLQAVFLGCLGTRKRMRKIGQHGN
jgi:hypothetical protein